MTLRMEMGQNMTQESNFADKVNGRGSRVRTRDLRFWRPSLYQLSYTPKVRCS